MSIHRFGKYLLLNKIGLGGMAEVHLAKQKGIKGFEKILAIKRILPHLTEDAEFISMFINEAKLAALLSHQNIVQIFDLGHFENNYYIAMEYVMGKDLRSVLQHTHSVNRPLSTSQCLLIASKILAGLDYSHRKKDLSGNDLNIVHRDINPQNVLVSYEGEVKLVDFGIAKAASQSSETQAGFIKGKLAYMAPEQAWGKRVDCRTDIFAAGIILYEMLTGCRLFKGENELSLLEKVREAKILPPPSQINKEVSPELEAILFKALAKNPDDRFQTASEFELALEDHMTQKGYDFSAVRLSRFLQELFSSDLKTDSERFRAAEAAVATTPTPDKNTVVSPIKRKPRPITPSHPTQVPVRNQPSKAWRPFSILRQTALTLTLLFLITVWTAQNDFPIIYSIKIRSAQAGVVLDELGRLPDRILDAIIRRNNTMARYASLIESPSAHEAARLNSLPETPFLDYPEPSVESFDTAPAESPESFQTFEPPYKHPLTPKERRKIQRLFSDAEEAYHQGQLFQVGKTLGQIIELDPRSAKAYHLLGLVKIRQKKPLQAIQIFEQASRKFPDHPAIHYDLGFIYMNRGVISLAQRELNRGLQLDPTGPKAEKATRILDEISRIPLDERTIPRASGNELSKNNLPHLNQSPNKEGSP